ncbi:hypothetical protein ATERTT37_003225 [Aspergillus terreus]
MNQIIAILIALKECWHSAHSFLSATPWPSSPCNIKAFIKLTETRVWKDDPATSRFNHEYLKELGRKFKQNSAKGVFEGLDFIADINSSYENLTQRHTRGRTLAMLRSLWNRWNTSSSKRTGWCVFLHSAKICRPNKAYVDAMIFFPRKLGIAWDTWMRVQQLRILVGTAFTDDAMRTGISKKTIAIVEVKARTRSKRKEAIQMQEASEMLGWLMENRLMIEVYATMAAPGETAERAIAVD